MNIFVYELQPREVSVKNQGGKRGDIQNLPGEVNKRLTKNRIFFWANSWGLPKYDKGVISIPYHFVVLDFTKIKIIKNI